MATVSPANGDGTEASEDSTEVVMGGDAVGQVEEGAQLVLARQASSLDLDKGIGASGNGTQCDGEDIEQQVCFVCSIRGQAGR